MAPRQNKIALTNRFSSASIEAKRLAATVLLTLLICCILPLIVNG